MRPKKRGINTESVHAGDHVTVRYFAPANTFGGTLKRSVDAALAEQSASVRAARFAESEGMGNLADNLAEDYPLIGFKYRFMFWITALMMLGAAPTLTVPLATPRSASMLP